MKSLKHILCIVILSALIGNAIAQITSISDVAHTPVASAVLDVFSTSKGMLVPRMTLAQRNAISSPATGLLIYQTNSSPGFWYFNGSIWVSFSTSLGWVPGGNSLAIEQTLGTISNHDLPFITNGIEKMRLTATGQLGIGSTNFSVANPERLLVDYGVTGSNTLAMFRGDINDYLQINFQNTNDGINASTDYVATADNGTDSTNYIDLGINSSTYAPGVENFGGSNDGYLYTNAQHLLIGTAQVNTDLIFMVSGGQIAINQALRINGNSKNIIIGRKDGTSSPIGNTVRGPNAAGGNYNGGDLTLQAGRASGGGTGGNLVLNGGGTVSGTGGAVNINVNTNNAVNINTGSNTQNVTIGSSSNNIILPKWTTVGGIYYNATAGGQLAGASSLIWDNTNTRLGVGTATPSVTLHVVKATGTGATRDDEAIIEATYSSAASPSFQPTLNLIRQFPTASYTGATVKESGVLNFGHRNSGSATFLDLAQVTAATYGTTSRISFYTRTGMTNGNPGGGTLAENAWVDGNVLHAANLNGGATTLSCDANGNIIRTPSDARLKTNIVTIDNALDKVLQMRGVNYNWINTKKYGSQRQIGFIAQELEKVVPEAVSSGGEYKSVNYQLLTAVLAEAIKTQQKKIEELKAKVAAHNIRITKLEQEYNSIGSLPADKAGLK